MRQIVISKTYNLFSLGQQVSQKNCIKVTFVGKSVCVVRKEQTLLVCMNGQGASQSATVNGNRYDQSTETTIREEKDDSRRVNLPQCLTEQPGPRSTSPCRNRSTSPVSGTSELSPHKVNISK